MKKALLSAFALVLSMMAYAQPTSVPTPTGDDIVGIYGSQLNHPVGQGFNYYDWGSGSQGEVYSVNGVETYKIPDLKWFGSQFSDVDASNKATIHLDIYPMEDMDLAIALICWNDNTNGNWGERGVNNTLTGGQWNSIDIDMQALVDRGGHFEKLYQIKFVSKVVAEATDPYGSDGFQNGDGTKTFYVGNIYATGTRVVDNEAPVLVSAEATEVLGNQVTLTMKATDNNEQMTFIVTDAFNGKTYSAQGVAGEDVALTVKGLNAETAYSWTVQAKDMAGNLSENTITVEFTTGEGFKLTAAPAVQHNTTLYDIFSIYCDAFEKSAAGAFFNTWGSAGEILSEVQIAEGDKIEKVEKFGYLGNEFTTTTDLRGYTVHMDLLSTSTELTQIGLTPITQSGEASTLYTITPGQWTSLDIPLSNWETLNAQYTFQWKWDRGDGDDLYIDNFYFWKEKEVEMTTVTGTVTDTNDAAIEGVTVTVTVVPAEAPAGLRRAQGDLTYTGITDANGAYNIEVPALEGATYNISFEKDGYVSQTIENADITAPANVQLTADINTAVNDLSSAKSIASITYVNAAGQTSRHAFDGVNIVVTRYTDGSTSTTKVVR